MAPLPANAHRFIGLIGVEKVERTLIFSTLPLLYFALSPFV